MELIGSIANQGTLQGQINDANGYLTGVISNAGLLGGQVVAERGLKGDKGDTGDTGATGNGIASVAFVSSSGLVDTYKITFTNGTETTFDVTNGQDGIDGIDGADGFSPIANVAKVGDTATITITDGGGTTTTTITDGQDGADGHSPVVTASKVGKVTTVSVDGSAIATINDGNDGQDGSDGQDGADGYSPSAIVAKVDNTATITITDKNGTTTATVSDGDVNVQSDWNEADNTKDDYIKNKPTIPANTSDLNNDSGFITSPNVVYCTCSTAGGTAAKVATIVSGTLSTLSEGCQAIVKFANANSVASPTLKVGTTDAKSIRRYGTSAPSTSAASSWNADSPILFVYDGTYWRMTGWLNSTYSEISEANITSGTGSSTGLVSGRRAKKAVEAFAPVKSVNGATGAITTHDVPSGGTSGQVLAKDSNDDYALAWTTVSGGGDVVYATSSDSASTVAKTATIVSGTLTTLTSGVQAIVKFANTNTASSPTLNIGGTGAKSIKRYGTTAVGQNQNESWVAGSPVLFVYDGTNWVIAGWLNTTYSGGTSTGITTGTDNLNYIWSPKQIHDGISGMLPTVNNATLTIQKNGTTVKTFTANASSNVTANITVPTTASDIGAQPTLVSGTNIKTINNTSLLGSGDISVAVGGTPIPTASDVAEFDPTAHMNSTDMTAQQVEDFVDELNVGASGLLNMFYPVGSYYETSDTTFNPNVSWGGTWVSATGFDSGTILFNNDSSSMSGVTTLSETSANFKRFDIMTHDNDDTFQSVSVYNPNGKQFTVLSSAVTASPTIYFKAKTFSINGTQIDTAPVSNAYKTAQQMLGSSCTYGNYINITQVVGYKEITRWRRTA